MLVSEKRTTVTEVIISGVGDTSIYVEHGAVLANELIARDEVLIDLKQRVLHLTIEFKQACPIFGICDHLNMQIVGHAVPL